jgi:3-keto-5-aminohexanoate cleavage enzyme
MDPIIIKVAPNGARKTTADLAQIPVTPETIAVAAKEFYDAGASMIHLHVRDADEKHTISPAIYREAIAAIREKVGDELIIQCTSEAVGIYKPEEQIDMVRELKPEAVSLALRELIPAPSYEESSTAFFKETFEAGIMQQFILYSIEEVAYFAKLRKQGVIPGKKVSVLFVLGKKFAAAGDASAWSVPDDLDPYLETFDGDLKLSETIWHTCAFGGNENAVMQKVIACGGNPRIGFENNHFMADGSIAPSNAALISQFVAEANKSNRHVATATEARKLLRETIEPKE